MSVNNFQIAWEVWREGEEKLENGTVLHSGSKTNTYSTSIDPFQKQTAIGGIDGNEIFVQIDNLAGNCKFKYSVKFGNGTEYFEVQIAYSIKSHVPLKQNA